MMRFQIGNFKELRSALAAICGEFAARGVPDDTVFDCKLVVDELVSNVLQHGGGEARLTVEYGDGIRVCVRGERDFRPPDRSVCSTADEERGRGLFLVDALAQRREYDAEEGICVIIAVKE